MMTNKTLIKSLLFCLVTAGSLPVGAAALTTSVPVLFSSPAEAKKAEEYVYAFAQKLIAEKKFAAAAAILKELNEAGSELPSPDEFIRLLNHLDDHTSIIDYYEKNRTRSFEGETYAYIGIAYMEQKNVASARVCFDKAAAANSSAGRPTQTTQGKSGQQKNPPLLTGPRQSSSVQTSPAASSAASPATSPAASSAASSGTSPSVVISDSPTTATRDSDIASPYNLPLPTYHSLLEDLQHVGQAQPPVDKKVNLSAELRYHYAFNNGTGLLGRDSSGLRLYLGANTDLKHGWRAAVMAEGQRNIRNYNNQLDLSHYYVAGKTGETQLTVGKFGYLMADGNIYDSAFTGIRADLGEAIQYTVAAGDTNNNRNVFVSTARYSDYDYDLELGAYHYQPSDGSGRFNSIGHVSGTYRFSNFSLGARLLHASLADTDGNRNGYVLSFDYGELKSWRPRTYSLFSRYYDQPRYTYIEHGMNGLGNQLEGFTGYSVGAKYTLRENLIAGAEYYHLSGKASDEKANTTFVYISYYF